MHLIAYRFSYGFISAKWRWPTLSRLPIPDGRELYRLEDPWNNNEPFNSCVPDGIYDLVPHSTAKHPDTWAMVNPQLNVYHQQADIPAGREHDSRFACLFSHTGNLEDHVSGCGLTGMSLDMLWDKNDERMELAVTNSRKAMQILRALLGVGSEGHTFEIRSYPGAHLFG